MIKYLPINDITASFSPYLEKAIETVVQSGWYLNGDKLRKYEKEFASYIGTNYCIGVANGLDALTLALLAMKKEYHWNDNDEVIVPDMTFIATAIAVVRAGLFPRLADVNTDALLTVETIDRIYTPRVRCVIPVHLYGHCAPMNEICDWAQRHHVKILEDAAQAHGAKYKKRKAGSWGDISAFSFYPGKNLGSLGNGGAVTTNDEHLAKTVRTLANYGAQQKYVHTEIGVNSRLEEIQAAALSIKLPRLDEDNAKRRKIANLFNLSINNPRISKPYNGRTEESIFHIYPLRCQKRDALKQHLKNCGIETLIHYPLPISRQPCFSPIINQQQVFTPIANDWANSELSIPLHPFLTQDEVRQIIEAINSFIY